MYVSAYVWQFPLKLLHLQNPPNRETQIFWRYLVVQIQFEIFFDLNLCRGIWVSELVGFGFLLLSVESVTYHQTHKQTDCIVKEPYKRDYILQKRPIILRSLLIVATPYIHVDCIYKYYAFFLTIRPRSCHTHTHTHTHTRTPTQNIHTHIHSYM